MTRICIVSHFAYGAMLGGAAGHVGGVERQTTLLARWLVERRHRVTLITWDEGQGPVTQIDGVTILGVCRQDAGLRGLRFFHPRWTGLNAALARADADVYYQNCGDYVTGQVAAWCVRHRRPFVYSIANDPDVDPTFPKLASRRERLLYSYGLRHATRTIVQTANQQQMLQRHFGLRSVIIPMPCPGPSDAEFTAPAATLEKPRLVWVARIAKVKRLEWVFDIARALPDFTIDVAGGADPDDAYAMGVLKQVGSLPNVRLLGRVSRDRIPEVYRGAAALICTSEYEGFPNTFLEAWSHGVPLVSTHDPDDLTVSRNIGKIAHDLPTFIRAIRELVASPTRWEEMSRNARTYYAENHTEAATMPLFERELLTAAVRHSPRSPGGRHVCQI